MKALLYVIFVTAHIILFLKIVSLYSFKMGYVPDGLEIHMDFLRWYLSDWQEIQVADFWYGLQVGNWSYF